MSESVVVFKKPKNFDTIINAFSKFDEQLGLKVNPDGTITSNKVSTEYKISATIDLDKEIFEVPEEGFNLGIISLNKLLKVLEMFNKETFFYIRKGEGGILKLYLVEDKKVSSIPISNLIKSDESNIKNKDVLFNIKLTDETLSFINKASKVSNMMILQVAFDTEGNCDLIIGDIKESSEYLSIYTLTKNVENYEILNDSPISKLFFSYDNYNLVIRYNLTSIIKALLNKNLTLSILKNGALLITEEGDNYKIEYGFIPIG